MSAIAEQDWLLSVAGSSVRDFYVQIGVDLPNRAGVEAEVRCFANSAAHNREDRNPSCSVNLTSGLWKCHGCGEQGNAFQAAVALGYSEQRARELAQQHGLFLEAVKSDESAPRLPDERKLTRWRQDLLASPVIMGRLEELKGWSPRAIVRCGLGWDGERLMFTIRDKRLKRVGVVRYHPNPPAGVKKSKALPGSKRLLFPPPEVMSRKLPLYVVEGEPASVSVRSCGLQAVAVPGANGWRPEFAQRLAGFRLVLLPDADGPGRGLAERVVRAVPNVRVVELEQGDTGRDVGDWVAEASKLGGLGQVRRVLERSAA